MRSEGKCVIAIVAGAAALAAPAQAVTPPPYNPTGHLKLSNVGSESAIHVKFVGDLPKVRNGEYVDYLSNVITPPGGDHCNSFGIDTVAGQAHPKHTSTTWDPTIGMEWGFGETPHWCGGSWYAQAVVKTKKNGAYYPRRVFARKYFSIG
jgi:hypothetical protein